MTETKHLPNVGIASVSRRWIAVGAAAGVCIGTMAGAGTIADAVEGLLVERCLPFVVGETPDTAGLRPVTLLDGTEGWAEPDTRVAITLSMNTGDRRSCSLRDDLRLWTKAERAAVMETAEDFAKRRVAPLNDEPLVVYEAVAEGVGDPHIIWRAPGTDPSYSVYFITFRTTPAHSMVSVNYAPFNLPVHQAGDSDA